MKNDAENSSPMDAAPVEEVVRAREHEAREQISALLEAVCLLSKMAAMDPADACQRRRHLRSRAAGGWNSENGKKETADGDTINKAQKRCSGGNNKPKEKVPKEVQDEENSAVIIDAFKGGADDRVDPVEKQCSGARDGAENGAKSDGSRCTRMRSPLLHEDGGEGSRRPRDDLELNCLHNDGIARDRSGGTGDAMAILGEIDALQEQWALEQTAIPALLASIQRLQSNLSTVTADSDSATAEMCSLHRSLADSRYREQRLERAVKKLYKQNKTLKERLAKKKRDRKSLTASLKDAVSGMKLMKRREEELEEREIANRLRAHESMLRKGSMSSRSRSEEVGAEGTVTAASPMHILENRDDASSFAESEHPEPYGRQLGKVEDFDSGSIGRGSTLSSVIDIDALSVTSLSESSVSTTSVDYSGVATVRLEPSPSFPPPAIPKDDADGSILAREASGDDGINFNLVSARSMMRFGDTIGGSGSGGPSRPRSSLFSSTSSTGQLMTRGRDRAASADEVLSWSSVRASFGVGSSSKVSGDSEGDSVQKEKASTSSTIGQRFMTQMRSPGAQVSTTTSGVYALTFPAGRKIGLQFQKIHIEMSASKSEDVVSHGQGFDGVSNASPFREAAADLSADLKAIGVTIDSILLGSGGSSNNDREGTVDTVGNIKHSTVEPFSLGSGGGAPGESVADDDDILPDIAFLVCGFCGFDDELNVRPSIGARLISIDGESLERGNWTFKRLRAVIEARANSSSPGGDFTFTMSFRNEPLTTAHQELLNSAVSKSEEEHKSAGLADSPDDSSKKNQ